MNLQITRIYFVLVLGILGHLTGYCQGQNNIWCFGDKVGLDFNFNPPKPFLSKINSVGSPSTISDPEGRLLFYSNGQVVHDRNHNIMPNGTGLVGGTYSIQNSLIVPYPGSGYLYYLFTTEDLYSNGGLSYSIVDMRLNGGMGDVVQGYKNISVRDEVAGLTAIIHKNGAYIWIITHSVGSTDYQSYLLTNSGLSTDPVISSIGSILNEVHSFLISSSSGKKLALGSINEEIVEVVSFNSETGLISDLNKVDDYFTMSEDPYSLGFSSNDSLLYADLFIEGVNIVYNLHQIDLSTHNIFPLNGSIDAVPSGIQMGPDKKIYCLGNLEGIGVIHEPNKIGNECQYEFNGILTLPGSQRKFGLPSPSPYSFPLNTEDIILGSDTILCSDETYTLDANYAVNCDSIEILWSDGSTGSSIEINESGTYSIEVNSSCGYFTDTVSVSFINCLPIVLYDLDSCVSVMSEGTHMDYSEFEPEYPVVLGCANTIASLPSRVSIGENKHSCTPGVNGSQAMCINSYDSCEYLPGHSSALIFDVTITPNTDSIVRLSSLEFYQQAPLFYNWINGSQGLNNYPTKFGLRVLKNGEEVFRHSDIETTSEWHLESIQLLNLEEFAVNENTVFRFEFLPYCLIGNGSQVNAWDIDEIRLFGGCQSAASTSSVVFGNVVTKHDQPVKNVRIELTQNQLPNPMSISYTDVNGNYLFENIELDESNNYSLAGYLNQDPLENVNALDLLSLQKHLLGISPFSDLFQHVAADINNDGRLSAMDLVELQKLILGISKEFPNNTSWRFGPRKQDMSGSDVLLFKEVSELPISDGQNIQMDMYGIKVGDITGNTP